MRTGKLFPLSFVLLAFALCDPLSAAAQYATCGITGTTDNQNRIVLAPSQGVHITVECQAWPHTVPFGRWGVSGNVGGGRFDGWHNGCSVPPFCNPGPGDEWNSCTSEFPPPNCDFYNHAACTQQITIYGINTHGVFSTWYPVSCPRLYSDGSWHGGCEEITGVTLTLTQNFMTLYELDAPDPDAVVQSLYFPDRSTTLTNCDPWGCTLAASPWADPIAYDDPVWPPLVYAQMAIAIRAELWAWDPWSDCDQYDCGICDPGGWCPPCVPLCFIPPC